MDTFPKDMLGPKMLALRDDRQRKFAYFMACAELNGAEAARQAGYSDTSEAAKVVACNLMQRPSMIEAVQECSRKILGGLAPLAIMRARQVLNNPQHPSHARMIETVLDRTGFFAETKHSVTVEHKVDVKELEGLARRLAAEAGIPEQRLIGAPVIEGEVVDVVHQQSD